MWRPAVLRCLIALNWGVAGLASAQVVYSHPQRWGGEGRRWAHEQLAWDAPDLEPGTEEHGRRSAALFDEYKARTVIVGNSGWWGWGVAMVGGAATAVGLMAVFPGVQAAARRPAERPSSPAARFGAVRCSGRPQPRTSRFSRNASPLR